MQAVRIERGEDGLLRSGHDARRIEIFDSEEPMAAAGPCEEIGANGGDEASHMQGSGG